MKMSDIACRRLALQICGQLPDNLTDCWRVLDYVERLLIEHLHPRTTETSEPLDFASYRESRIKQSEEDGTGFDGQGT
jgi:hypothetical protein